MTLDDLFTVYVPDIVGRELIRMEIYAIHANYLAKVESHLKEGAAIMEAYEELVHKQQELITLLKLKGELDARPEANKPGIKTTATSVGEVPRSALDSASN